MHRFLHFGGKYLSPPASAERLRYSAKWDNPSNAQIFAFWGKGSSLSKIGPDQTDKFFWRLIKKNKPLLNRN